MFKKLQWRMTLMYTFILIGVLLVTNISIYYLMSGYNSYQMGVEIRNMLESINSSEWLYADELSLQDSSDQSSETKGLSVPVANESKQLDNPVKSTVQTNSETDTNEKDSSETESSETHSIATESSEKYSNETESNETESNETESSEKHSNETDSSEKHSNETDSSEKHSNETGINEKDNSDSTESVTPEDYSSSEQEDHASPEATAAEATGTAPKNEESKEIALPNVKDLTIPKALMTFPVYMVFTEDQKMVQWKTENNLLLDQLLEKSQSMKELDAPKVVVVEGEEPLYYLLGKMPIIIQDHRLGYYVVARDVTIAYKTIDNLVRILIISLAAGALLSFAAGYLLAGRSLKPIKQAYQSKQEFLANASHELKTPLSVIMLSTETLDGEIDANHTFQHQVVDGIKDETLKMSELVSHLLFLSRSDTKTMISSKESFDLSELVMQEIRRLRPLAIVKDITLQEIGNQGIRFFGDRKLLASVVSILVDNAIKYTPSGGQVTVELGLQDGVKVPAIQLRIIDTGIGIPQEELSRVFDRFYRLDSSRSRETGGHGLGLSIAKEIVEQHGGTILVSSKVQVGTTFIVSMPLYEKNGRKSER